MGQSAPPAFPPSRELFIASADGKRRIKLLVFDPPGATPGPKPVYINFQGSGFIQPSLGSDGRLLTYIAREVGCVVVDGDYRKAPEHPFPAPYEDAHRVVSWVLENNDGQFDVNRVAVGGVSAGANLALAVLVNMPANTIKGVSVIVPAIDFTLPYAQRRAPPDMPEVHKKEPDRSGPIPPDIARTTETSRDSLVARACSSLLLNMITWTRKRRSSMISWWGQAKNLCICMPRVWVMAM